MEAMADPRILHETANDPQRRGHEEPRVVSIEERHAGSQPDWNQKAYRRFRMSTITLSHGSSNVRLSRGRAFSHTSSCRHGIEKQIGRRSPVLGFLRRLE